MLQEIMGIIQKGQENGKNMIIRLRLPSGLEIIGLATETYYGGDWDYGSTWNYLVLADKPFLVDTGRVGQGKMLFNMMEAAGFSGKDLESIVITHGHEDHDGGLYELAQLTGKKIMAQSPYERLVNFFPDKAPRDVRKDFPASCWHCFMPDSFARKHCLDYHKERSILKIESINDSSSQIDKSTKTFHMPGHSPDSISILVGDEVIIVGDNILPEITPFPSREAFFYQVKDVVSPEFTRADSLYGLRAFIKSMKKLKEIGKQHSELLVLPGHRLFYNNRWNELDLQERVDELVGHHIERCAEILNNLEEGAKTPQEIAKKHFEPHLLEGFGIIMAKNEIISHCELMSAAGDVTLIEDNKYVATGSTNFESLIQFLEPG